MTIERSSYLYELPQELIATQPVSPRDNSRLLLMDRSLRRIHHKKFRSLPELLEESALLVVNNTKVIPARIPGRRKTGGTIEVLLVKEEEPGIWICRVKNSGRLKQGEILELGDESFTAEFLDKNGDGDCFLRFEVGSRLMDKLKESGFAPLPPYIHKTRNSRYDRETDLKDYQTVFAKEYGAIAAPTAGLHFTPEVNIALQERGIEILEITLHVGLGTFEAIRVEDLSKHVMHEEVYEISETVAEKIDNAKIAGRKVVAVGTTVTRTLESAWRDGSLTPGSATTRLFIHPPFRFNVVDQLLTNFHLPGSTLIMLVAALAGRGFVMEAYQEAINQRYRFYSYGDCMLIQ